MHSAHFRRKLIPIELAFLLAVSALFTVLVPMATSASGGQTAFTSFELGPFSQPGVNCPNGQGTCINSNAEPQIGADNGGNFYASSEFLPPTLTCSTDLSLANPTCGGTGAWKSTNGGLNYVTLPSPNSFSAPLNASASAWGGDTDLATAPQKNSNGLYNIYVISLERATGPLLNVEESTSADGGQTWSINPTGVQIPGDDRPWVAADSSSKVCISYFAEAALQNAVSCSFDSGLTFTQPALTLDSNHAWLAFEDGEGNIAIDSNSHVIYVIFPGVANEAEALADDASVNCTANGICPYSLHALWIAVSLDGGATFTDHLVYNDPNTSVSIGHQFPSVAVDNAGDVETAFSDNHNVYFSYSADFANTWSAPVQVSQSPSNTAIEPWLAAGSPDRVDIVWYGTSYYDGVTIPDNYPMSASWNVYFAQSLNAFSGNPSFAQTTASPVNHYGGLCESGVTCTGNRDLFDDFGVAASPKTGLASIVYSDDQYINSSNEPASPACTASQTNTFSCDHTDIATQTSGPGIFHKPKGFQIHGQGLTLASGSPKLTLSLDNVGNYTITSISVQLAGVSTSLTWNAALPLFPSATISGQTTSLTGLLLTAGGVYTLSVTATLSDGETVTQSISVIGTLV
ncbi:MAG: hypothetical protein KGI38_00085 [Thaumarchaeota archaeon]|nr:hypothetical protein [Nitrososphaerota archaeon]